MAITEEERAKAMRLARAIASDIAVYHEAEVIRGIQEDSLFDLLREPIAEGRELYRSRVSAELHETTNYFERALCDLLLRGKGHLRSKLW
jgi:hypothetical protein